MTRSSVLAGEVGLFALLIGVLPMSDTRAAAAPQPKVEVVDVAPVWAGHPVGFALLTQGKRQFVAFYDAERRMTIGARTLPSARWQLVVLPEAVKWDSHNSITMTADDEGVLHLSGNMHCVPLVYFRTREPGDIATFERVSPMVGDREKRATYPRFLRGARNELLFTYRDGSSGSGDQIWNVYEPKTRTWRRLLDKPLTDGRGERNAYFHGPVRGPDGTFHLCWVWRDTPDAATNHHLSYARSKDLIHWETSAGKSLAIPITFESGEVVDPAPPGGGLINGNNAIGFDTRGRVVISYHKYDANGNLQIYNARVEDGRWRSVQVTDWKYRWEFKGGGSIPFEVRVRPVQVSAGGKLVQGYSHDKYGSGGWIVDEETLKPVGPAPRGAPDPLAAYRRVESAFPGVQVNWAGDLGAADETGARYSLRWETLGSNRDRPREGALPPPSMLKVYRVSP